MIPQDGTAPPATAQHPGRPGAPLARPRSRETPSRVAAGQSRPERHVAPPAAGPLVWVAAHHGWFSRSLSAPLTEPYRHQLEIGRKLAPFELTNNMIADAWVFTIVWTRVPAIAGQTRPRPAINPALSFMRDPYHARPVALPRITEVKRIISQNPTPPRRPQPLL